MTYINDIFINLHQDYFEFYEWNKNDYIEHIKKIPIIKTSSKTLYSIIHNIINIDSVFLANYSSKCEKYHNSKYYNYLVLTNSIKAIVISFNTKGNIIKKSSLIFEDEDNICILSRNCKSLKIPYKIIKKENNSLTRLEKENKRNNLRNIKKASYNCLKYLYFDCFNKEENNIEVIVKTLSRELKNNNTDVMNKSSNLFNLIYQQNK